MREDYRSAPKARTDNIVVSELKDELLLYCLDTHKAYCLNKTAASVYQSADGAKTISEIAERLSKEFKSSVTEEFVSFTFDELREKNLLEKSVARFQPNMHSRREAVKRIGLSTAVALPLVTMLVAPRAADAQSATACVTQGNDCSGGRTCCAGLNCCGGFPNDFCDTICPV